MQDKLRIIPGVPIIYLHGKTPTLESVSEASRNYAEDMQKGLGMTTWEKENVKALRRQAGMVEEKEEKYKKKKKKGGPNPLSCLKKKKKSEIITNKNNTKSGKVRKKKIKIASHIKEALMCDARTKK